MEDRIIVIQIQHALDLYKVLNGSLPQTTEAFMEEIIVENGIRLADPPDGKHYVWDSEADDGEGRTGVLFLESLPEE